MRSAQKMNPAPIMNDSSDPVSETRLRAPQAQVLPLDVELGNALIDALEDILLQERRRA